MSEIAACTLIQEEPDRKTERYLTMFKDYPDVPDTDCNLPIFSSGWGDGYYPVYFGYNYLVARIEKLVFPMEANSIAFMDILNQPVQK